MPVSQDRPAPYTSPSTILELIDRHRNKGLPTPINKEVLGRSGISDSMIPRTLQALPTLDLVDDQGEPTDFLEELRRAPEADFKNKLAEWLRHVYEDVFNFIDPRTDDETAVRDAFRNYHPIGQQQRMVSLFLGLCQAADLYAPQTNESKPLRRRRRRAATVSGGVPTQSQRQNAVPPAKPNSMPDAGRAIPSPIRGLLESLPPEGGTWTQARRDAFVKTFTTVLDFCFGIEQQEDGKDDNE